jgi:hypothetical protein
MASILISFEISSVFIDCVVRQVHVLVLYVAFGRLFIRLRTKAGEGLSMQEHSERGHTIDKYV